MFRSTIAQKAQVARSVGPWRVAKGVAVSGEGTRVLQRLGVLQV